MKLEDGVSLENQVSQGSWWRVCADRKQEMLVHYIDTEAQIHGEITGIVHNRPHRNVTLDACNTIDACAEDVSACPPKTNTMIV